METPSIKVITQLVVGIIGAVLAYLAADQSWVGFLPESAAGPIGIVLGAVAAYWKPETNPASSSYASRTRP